MERPFSISCKLSPVHYQVHTCDNHLVATTVHANKLKHFLTLLIVLFYQQWMNLMILYLMLLLYPLIVLLQMILLPLVPVMQSPYKMLTRILTLVPLTLQMSSNTSLQLKSFSNQRQQMGKYPVSDVIWEPAEINAFWINSKERPLRFNLFLVLFISLTPQPVYTQESSTLDYNLNGQQVTYYLESLMLSHIPKAIVFSSGYQITQPVC